MPPPASPPLWAIAVALPHELKGLLPCLSVRAQTSYGQSRIFEGSIESQECLVIQTGLGLAQAEQAMRFALERYSISSMLSTGYCGGLHPELKTAEAVLSDPAADAQGLDPHVPDATLAQRASHILQHQGVRLHRGMGLSCSKPVLHPRQKQELADKTGAIAVDMESHRLMVMATQKKIASLTVRFVVDALGDELADTGGFFDAEAKLSPRALIQQVVRRPKMLWMLPGLGQKAHRARQHMASFVKEFLAAPPFRP